MKAYQYDSETKEFKNEIERQIDPLASKLAGKSIYLMPGDSTDIPPLKEKKGYKIIWKGTKWDYLKEEKKEEAEEYIPTEKDKLNTELGELQWELQQTDYKALKFAEGLISEEDYIPIKAQRQELRTKINNIRSKLEGLKN